jgi:hypothetical protein
MKIANAISRRSVLAGLAATASAPLLSTASRGEVGPSGSVCSNLPSPQSITATPQRAISLRQVSADLAAGRPAVLDKLTRLDGYIVDAENRDIILWGLSEPDQPNLFIEDFVVALRAAHGKYGVLRDGVNWITNPVISIDPVAAVTRQIAPLNLRTSEGQARFRQICATPQTVRVEGMPRNTRLAKSLVDADYRMKMVGQGSVTLPIQDGFPSHWQVRLQKWKDSVDRRQSGGHESHTRFWFQSGRFTHQANEEGDTIFLDRAQVVLNDEDEAVSGNKLDATGRVDAITRAFCCAWSARMDDVYKSEPIWRDMHNIFRHFSIARIMKDLGAIGRANFDAQVLLERYEVPNVPVYATLPGLGNFELHLPPGSPAGMTAATNFVCGGVSVGFSKPIERIPVSAETMNSTAGVVSSRPAANAVSWVVNAGATATPQASSPGTSNRPGAASSMPTGGRFGTIDFQ